MGPKVSRSSRKPVEIGRVSAGRSSSAAAAAEADGKPDTPARRRRAIAISGVSLLVLGLRVAAAAGEWEERERPGRAGGGPVLRERRQGTREVFNGLISRVHSASGGGRWLMGCLAVKVGLIGFGQGTLFLTVAERLIAFVFVLHSPNRTTTKLKEKTTQFVTK